MRLRQFEVMKHKKTHKKVLRLPGHQSLCQGQKSTLILTLIVPSNKRHLIREVKLFQYNKKSQKSKKNSKMKIS